MLIKPINAFLKDSVDPTTMDYLGRVEDNNDPEKLGRIKVRIEPYSDFNTEDLPWASPILGSCGNSSSNCGLNVPEIGSQVRIFFPSHDMTAPYYRGAELNESNRTTFFDDDYPHTYGYKDSTGNFYKVNKATGTAQFQHNSSTNLKIAPDGSLQIALNNGAYFTFSSSSAFELSIGAVTIMGTPDGSLSIVAENELEIRTPKLTVSSDDTSFSGNVSVGTGVTGKFAAGDKVITVTSGIITSIE